MSAADRIRKLAEQCADDGGTAGDVAVWISRANSAERSEMARRWLAEAARDVLRERALEVERRSFAHQRKASLGLPADASIEAVAAAENQRREAETQAENERKKEFRAESARLRDEAFGALCEDLFASTQKYRDHLHAEWQGELLASGFSLPDGTQTTWGEATIQQHKIRRDMFIANAATNVEGAARHDHAIQALTAAEVTCLNDLLVVAA